MKSLPSSEPIEFLWPKNPHKLDKLKSQLPSVLNSFQAKESLSTSDPQGGFPFVG